MNNSFLQSITFLDLLDIITIAIILYYIFLVIQGTRAVQILKGVAFLLVIMLISRYLGLQAVYWLLQLFLYGTAVALPIVFQPELRRALGYLGRGGGFRDLFQGISGNSTVNYHAIDTLIWSVEQLAESRTGALLVIEKETGLEEYIETGTILDAAISAKLILTIFFGKNPLHDGAVIIRNFRVISANSYLPLSENIAKTMGKTYGTRHRAALGLSEQTDAFIIVVSEETGGISVARNGKLTRVQSAENLKKLLLNLYRTNKNLFIPGITSRKGETDTDDPVHKKKSSS